MAVAEAGLESRVREGVRGRLRSPAPCCSSSSSSSSRSPSWTSSSSLDGDDATAAAGPAGGDPSSRLRSRASSMSASASEATYLFFLLRTGGGVGDRPSPRTDGVVRGASCFPFCCFRPLDFSLRSSEVGIDAKSASTATSTEVVAVPPATSSSSSKISPHSAAPRSPLGVALADFPPWGCTPDVVAGEGRSAPTEAPP